MSLEINIAHISLTQLYNTPLDIYSNLLNYTFTLEILFNFVAIYSCDISDHCDIFLVTFPTVVTL